MEKGLNRFAQSAKRPLKRCRKMQEKMQTDKENAGEEYENAVEGVDQVCAMDDGEELEEKGERWREEREGERIGWTSRMRMELHETEAEPRRSHEEVEDSICMPSEECALCRQKRVARGSRTRGSELRELGRELQAKASHDSIAAPRDSTSDSHQSSKSGWSTLSALRNTCSRS